MSHPYTFVLTYLQKEEKKCKESEGMITGGSGTSLRGGLRTRRVRPARGVYVCCVCVLCARVCVCVVCVCVLCACVCACMRTAHIVNMSPVYNSSESN